MAFSQSTEEHLKFAMNSSVTVTVVSGDITQMQADAVVVGESERLTGIGAVANAFAAVGGLDYSRAKYDMITTQVPSSLLSTFRKKQVYWCDAGRNFKYKRIYHAILPKVYGLHQKDLWKTDIADLYKKVCEEADQKNRETSIVMPVLGSGGGGGDFNDTVWGALNGIRAFFSIHLKDVYLVERDQFKAKKIVSWCQKWIDRQQKVYHNVSCRILSAGSASGSSSGTSAGGLTPQPQTASSTPSGGLHGFQGNTTWPSASSTRPTSSTAGGLRSATGRPSSPSNYGSSSTVNNDSWRDPPRQATGGDDDFDKGNSHPEKASGARYEGSSTSSSRARRHRPQQSKSLDEEPGNYNYHMENVAKAAQERRRAGKERSGQGHKDEVAAMLTENSFEGRESQGRTSGHYGGHPEHHHSHRRDGRNIISMEVDEDPRPTSPVSQNRSKTEPHKTEINPNAPNVVVLDKSSGESSDDETSHPGTERQAAADRWEPGSTAHLSKTRRHLASSPHTEPTDVRFPAETQRYKGSRNGSNHFGEDFSSLPSSIGTSGTRYNVGDEEDYKNPYPAKSASKESFGRFGTNSASPTFSSMSKIEGGSRFPQDKGYPSLGSYGLSGTSSNRGRSDTSGRQGATGSQSSPLYSSMGATQGRQQILPDRGFSSLGSSRIYSSSRNWDEDDISGLQGTADSQPSSQLSVTVTEGRPRSVQGKGAGYERPLSHTGYTNGGHDKISYTHRSLSLDDDQSNVSPSGSDVRGAASSSEVSRRTGERSGTKGATAGNASAEGGAWEDIEERTQSAPEGKMVVTRNTRIQLDGCLGRGQRKKIVQQSTTADRMEENESKSPVPTNRGQRKSKASSDKGPKGPDSLHTERPPSTPGGVASDNADSHFRGQRKSKAQVPREDTDVILQRSSSSPDPALDRGQPLDTSTIGRGTENQEQPREKAAEAQLSEEGEGAGAGSRGQQRETFGIGPTAADSTARSSDRETLQSIVGKMPRARMNHFVNTGIHVPGYEGCGVIVVDYDIPDGIQKTEHSQPGSPYCGCAERAFLPDNEEGRRVLRLLEEAFDRRLTFQVCEQPGGQALVEWADIPHKTCLRGPRESGYPDSEYLGLVLDILREKYGLE